MKIVEILVALLPVILITIALLLARALRIVCRGTASSPSLSAVADDPFLYPFGEMPTIPRAIGLDLSSRPDTVSLHYGRGGRMRDASDFRAWGIPRFHSGGFVGSAPGPLVGERCESYPMSARQYERLVSAGALRRNESGGRPACLSGTAVVLTFPKGRA